MPDHAEDERGLVAYARKLGASDEEISAALAIGQLGPLTLDHAIRPKGASVPLPAFADGSGLDPALVRGLWLALGLPETSVLPFPVTPDVAEAIRVLAMLIPVFGEESVFGLARVIGSSTARMADALAGASRVGVEIPQRDTGTPHGEMARAVAATARDLMPVLWDAVGAVFRRHLVLVSYERWSTDDAQVAVTVQRTVGFVDLVGSTEVLRTMSVAEMADSVNKFEQLVGDRVTALGGRLVKLIGDEAMFVFSHSKAACQLALDLVASSPNPVRVGLAGGVVVALHGDYYGPTVNMAARLVSVAAASTILASESVHASASSRFSFTPRATGPLRGFPDVTTAYEVQGVRA